MRVKRGGNGAGVRRDEASEPKRIKPNFSFRRVSEVMEGVRLQGMRAAASKSNLQVGGKIKTISNIPFRHCALP